MIEESDQASARGLPQSLFTKRRFFFAGVTAIVTCYLLLALASALYKRPGCDEAWFASPGLNLATQGYMGTSVLEPSTKFPGGRDLAGIDRYTYWIMPLHAVFQAGWYRVVGFGLFQMRALSIFWGLIALACWYLIAEKLSGERAVALLTVTLIAFDYAFVRSAAHGRMDMMSAALGCAGFAAYLHFRERSLSLAVIVSQSLIAASIFTHPNGVLPFLAVACACLVLDRRRLRLRHFGYGALPYLVGAAAWGMYIAQAPQIFLTQFGGNTVGRFTPLFSPLASLKSEIVDRYMGGGAGRDRWVKALLALPYLAGLLGVLAIRELRRHPGYRLALWWALICVIYFWLLEGTRLYLYVVHVAPVCLFLLSAVVWWMYTQRRVASVVLIGAFGAWLALEAGSAVYLVYRDDMHGSYLPAVDFLREHAGKQDLVMGSAELGFQRGFDSNLVDDIRLGFRTGKRPAYIVVEKRYSEWIDWAKTRDPPNYSYIETLLTKESRLAYDQSGYRIYERR